MKETTSVAMPPCFEKFCQKLDSAFKTKAQKRELRHYLAGLLGESERKNITQIAHNNLAITYHKLHHFMTDSPWSSSKVNDRRLTIISQCRQTKIARLFSLIIDDSGHRKSGNFTDGVGRQYIGEVGKTDNGNVLVTTHIYDGVRSLPLDVEIYYKADNFPQGKEDELFQKKPEIALALIEKCLNRNLIPEVVLIDASYGNNSSLLNKLEEKKLTYIGAIAKNRKVKLIKENKKLEEKRIDEIAQDLNKDEYEIVELKDKKLWVALVKVEIEKIFGVKSIAIVMNASTVEKATEIDYLITNEMEEKINKEWLVKKYSERNWIEVFYREVKGWLGLSEYQLRNKESLMKHFVLVFCAYTFIQYHRLTGGFRRRWANKPLSTFREALEAFRTSVSYRFFQWLNENVDVFVAYKKSLGFVWG